MGLFENVRSESVARLNLREAVQLPPNSSVRDAVLAMRTGGLGCAIVVDDGRPVGMFTEAMLRQLLNRDPECLDLSLKDEMSSLVWVELDDEIEIVLNALEEKNTRFLCVLDPDGGVRGLTGQKGFMEYVAEHFPEVMVQRVGTNPFPGNREGA